jgi:hypothetical protein
VVTWRIVSATSAEVQLAVALVLTLLLALAGTNVKNFTTGDASFICFIETNFYTFDVKEYKK